MEKTAPAVSASLKSDMKPEMKLAINYELMFILSSDLTEKKIEDQLHHIRQIINDHGGKILTEDIWGLRNLAYRIKKQERGFYAVFNFEGNAKTLAEINHVLRIDQNVLRYLLIKTPKNYQLVTLSDYTQAAEKEAQEKAKEIAEKQAEIESRKPKITRKPEAPRKIEQVVVKPRPVLKPKIEEKAPTAKKEEKVDSTLLDNIIEDPDIIL